MVDDYILNKYPVAGVKKFDNTKIFIGTYHKLWDDVS